MLEVQIDTVNSDDDGSEGDNVQFQVCVEAVSGGSGTTLQDAVTATLIVDMNGKAGMSLVRIIQPCANIIYSLLQMVVILSSLTLVK